MNTLRAVIVDDEVAARRRLRRLLGGEPQVTIVGDVGTGHDALALVAREHPDVLFLDVQMPEMNGIEVARRVPLSSGTAVVFVTAFDQFAVEAFELHAMDYLLKPISAARLARSVARLTRPASVPAPDGPSVIEQVIATLDRQTRYPVRIPIRDGPRRYLLDVVDIDWVQAADNYVRIHVAGREHLVREPLTAFAAHLDPARFIRIHRSIIVQADRIVQLSSATHGDMQVVLRDGTTLTLTRTWRATVARILGLEP